MLTANVRKLNKNQTALNSLRQAHKGLKTGLTSSASQKTFLAQLLVCILLVPLFSLFSVSKAHAERATQAEMERVCQNWLAFTVSQKGAWAGVTSPQIVDVSELVEDDTVLARCFSIDPKGYVVVPVLKELPPVKAYSEENGLDVNKTHGMTQLLRDVLLNRTRLFIQFYGSLDASQPSSGDALLDRVNRQQWDRFLASPDEFESDLNRGVFAPLEQVGPLLTTSWHQGPPYNNYCPWGDGGRCVVGCVATAAAQIMAYHQWPEAGYGSYSYWWGGDYSCGGSSPGQWLSADFSDEYDWANIPDECWFGCSSQEQDALAELNYEVGVAFDMDYGRCASGTWASLPAWKTFFRYREEMDEVYRWDYSADSWFNVIKQQINQGLPMEYYIVSHAIVCDGWRETAGLKQYHMNYGWDDGHNAWYTLDNLYCPWEGCNYLYESLIRNIIPDRGIWFSADTTFGWVPLEVNFTGTSEYSVDSWTWDFGDGDSAFVQSPVHTYLTPGLFDVSLAIDTGGGTIFLERADYIVTLADSMIAVDAYGSNGSPVEMVVYARNYVPVQYIRIPFEIFGTLDVTYDSFSTAGCRTASFEQQSYLHYDQGNGRYTIKLQSFTTDLPPGNGSILLLYFTVPALADSGQIDTIEIDGYSSYLPLFAGDVAQYQPITVSGTISLVEGCCIGTRGDADGSGTINVADVTYLAAYLKGFGPEPP
ncbi:MAG: C10 family peptidase, partial [Candidatus Zixiibacteriota bacterium]